MELIDDRAVWTTRDIDDANLIRARELFADGLSVREVAEELGVGKSTAHRLRQQIEAAADDLSHRPTP